MYTVSLTVFTDLTPFFWFALINSPPPSPHLSPLHNDDALPLSTTDDHLFTGGTAPSTRMADAVREAEGNADGRASGKSLLSNMTHIERLVKDVSKRFACLICFICLRQILSYMFYVLCFMRAAIALHFLFFSLLLQAHMVKRAQQLETWLAHLQLR